jgi:hypothetical protein
VIRAAIYADRAAAEKAVAAIDAARHPDGTEEVIVVPSARAHHADPTLRERCEWIDTPAAGRVFGYRERRGAKTWAEPIDLDDGRCAVPWREDRLAALEGREVTVRGERVRVPRAQDVSEIEIATDDDGEPIVRDGRAVLREKREAGGGGIRGR